MLIGAEQVERRIAPGAVAGTGMSPVNNGEIGAEHRACKAYLSRLRSGTRHKAVAAEQSDLEAATQLRSSQPFAERRIAVPRRRGAVPGIRPAQTRPAPFSGEPA